MDGGGRRTAMKCDNTAKVVFVIFNCCILIIVNMVLIAIISSCESKNTNYQPSVEHKSHIHTIMVVAEGELSELFSLLQCYRQWKWPTNNSPNRI